jgi:hypothetical protein
MGAFDEYAAWLPAADKWLHPDGSVTDGAGNAISPPGEAGARDYASRSPAAAKWLMPDGSVVTGIPSTGGGTGNDDGNSEFLPQAEVPIVAGDALGDIFLSGHLAASEWQDDITPLENGAVYTDSAALTVS